jgi:hypothetical protein
MSDASISVSGCFDNRAKARFLAGVIKLSVSVLRTTLLTTEALLGCSTWRNKADDFVRASFANRVSDQYHDNTFHETDGLPALLPSFIGAILFEEGVRVVEHTHRVFEIDSVLRPLRFAFTESHSNRIISIPVVRRFCGYISVTRMSSERNMRHTP